MQQQQVGAERALGWGSGAGLAPTCCCCCRLLQDCHVQCWWVCTDTTVWYSERRLQEPSYVGLLSSRAIGALGF